MWYVIDPLSIIISLTADNSSFDSAYTVSLIEGNDQEMEEGKPIEGNDQEMEEGKPIESKRWKRVSQ